MRRAFTLIECLVVIVLTCTLAAMLLPVLIQAKRPAEQSVCMSNLRQISMAVLMYGTDNDEKYPLATDPADARTECPGRVRSNLPQVQGVLQSYVKSGEIWHCPHDSGIPKVGSDAVEPIECDFASGIDSLYRSFGSSYLYRNDLAKAGASQPASLFEGHHPRTEHPPAEVPLLYDAYGVWHGGKSPRDRWVYASMGDAHVARLTLRQVSLAETWVP